MIRDLTPDEDLVRRLPLPLAQLYRRAHNAKTALERHLAAFYLWEASLKLLASVAIVEYAEGGGQDSQLAELLTNLTRPALGHWWEFVRRLVPVLADRGDAGFRGVRDLLLGRTRDDLPRAAGLDAALGEALDGRGGARSTVRLSELFDRLVRYRSQELGHGAAGQRAEAFYERMGEALLAGVAEVIGRLDVLAGRRLVYVGEVRRVPSGTWLVERYELTGEAARRLESLELAREDTARLPRPEKVYVNLPDHSLALRSLHPLLVYDLDANEALFLNARRGRRGCEYIGYGTGRVLERPNLGNEQRELLALILRVPVQPEAADLWAARSQAEEPAAEASPSAPRRQLGEFELLSELGRGGTGVVYRAWQPSLGRQVALKVLPLAGDPRAEGRFAREIRAFGRVNHPNLVKVFTCETEGDRWFYAMEFIEGEPLGAVVDILARRSAQVSRLDLGQWNEAFALASDEARRGERPLAEEAGRLLAEAAQRARPPSTRPGPAPAGRTYVEHVVGLVRQVAGAAHALHEAGLVHRDIKPANIMVTGDGAQAVLMDLGVAQLADETAGRLTRTRQFVGTLRYASPEQVLAAGRLDRRGDVYSLGVTLWELLTLRPLYGATEETPTPELMERIQRQEAPRVRQYQPGVPVDLEAVVLKCLEKDPERRYPTAQELADELKRVLEGKPV